MLSSIQRWDLAKTVAGKFSIECIEKISQQTLGDWFPEVKEMDEGEGDNSYSYFITLVKFFIATKLFNVYCFGPFKMTTQRFLDNARLLDYLIESDYTGVVYKANIIEEGDREFFDCKDLRDDEIIYLAHRGGSLYKRENPRFGLEDQIFDYPISVVQVQG